MALIQEPSNQDIIRQSEIEDNKKKVLEANFRNRFNKWQKSVLIDFTNQFQNSMGIFGVSPERKKQLQDLIASHYIKVAETFISGLYIDEFKSEMTDQLYSKIENNIRNYINTTGEVHVNKILETTEKFAAIAYLFASMQFESIRERIRVFQNTFKNKLLSRTKATSFTETTGIAEFSKQVALDETTAIIPIAKLDDLKELQKISPNLTFKKLDLKKVKDPETLRQIKQRLYGPKKKWINMGDEFVRTSHLDAPIGVGNVILPVSQPYVLPGGLAMHPGDQSLGVAINEVIGCRCVLTYI